MKPVFANYFTVMVKGDEFTMGIYHVYPQMSPSSCIENMGNPITVTDDVASLVMSPENAAELANTILRAVSQQAQSQNMMREGYHGKSEKGTNLKN